MEINKCISEAKKKFYNFFLDDDYAAGFSAGVV